MHRNPALQLPIARAFDSTSSRWDHGEPWGREHGPLSECLPQTSALKVDTWQKECCDVNLRPINYQMTLKLQFGLSHRKFCIRTTKMNFKVHITVVKVIKAAMFFCFLLEWQSDVRTEMIPVIWPLLGVVATTINKKIRFYYCSELLGCHSPVKKYEYDYICEDLILPIFWNNIMWPRGPSLQWTQSILLCIYYRIVCVLSNYLSPFSAVSSQLVVIIKDICRPHLLT